MNALWQSVHAYDDLATRFLSFLVQWMARGFVILLLARLLTLAMRSSTAAARHLVWTAAVLGLLVLPVISSVLPAWRILPQWSPLFANNEIASDTNRDTLGGKRPAITERNMTGVRDGTLGLPQTPLTDAKNSAGRLQLPTSESAVSLPPAAKLLHHWKTLAVLIWCAVALVLAGRLVLGWCSLVRFQRRSSRLTADSWTSMLAQSCALLGMRRRVELLESGLRSMPMTWGVLTPRILFPLDAKRWPAERQQMVLLHELGHVKRFDILTQWGARIACCLCWCNPLVWTAARCMAAESEKASDDLVLGSGAASTEYAEHLVRVASGFYGSARAAPVTILMARPSTLEERVRAILMPGVARQASPVKVALVLIIGLPAVVFPVSIARERALKIHHVSHPTQAGALPRLPTKQAPAGDAREWNLQTKVLENDISSGLVELGPIVDRVVPNEERFHGALDIESGSVVIYPPEWTSNSQREQDSAELRWRHQFGIDISATGDGLIGYGTTGFETSAEFATISAAEVVRAATLSTQKWPELLAKVDHSYFFRTNEGTFGVIALKARSESPPGIAVHYKLLRPAELPKSQVKQLQVGNHLATELIFVPPGEFKMGDSGGIGNEKPSHLVRISRGFFLGKYEATNQEFNAFRPEHHPVDVHGKDIGCPTDPVVDVSWNDAVAYCAWLSTRSGMTVRLPTEAEWEYACRARTTTDYSWGNDLELAHFYCNAIEPRTAQEFHLPVDGFPFDDGYRLTAFVGTYRPNAFGLYDMHGNVWEWCEDTWHENYDGAPDNGSAWTAGGTASSHVLRGGSWGSPPESCRSAMRGSDTADARNEADGFRIVVETQDR